MSPAAAPTDIRFEHRTGEDPVLGIGTTTPRLSWRIPRADADFELGFDLFRMHGCLRYGPEA